MLKGLFYKLTLSIFSLFTVVIIFATIFIYGTQQKNIDLANQNLHLRLAEDFVNNLSFWLIDVDSDALVLNKSTVKQAFSMVMQLGPSFELYVLDIEGKVIAYDAPQALKAMQVDIEQIADFLAKKKQGQLPYPIKNTDPKTGLKKVFSSAQFTGFSGYLYIIIGGEKYDNVWKKIHSDQQRFSALLFLWLSVATLMLLNFLIFWWVNRPLKKLSLLMNRYAVDDDIDMTLVHEIGSKDNIGRLAHQFSDMAMTIKQQVSRLNRLHELRKEFLFQISHDLRTPLASQQAWLETLLINDQQLSTQQQHYLKQALESGDLLGRRINEIMQLAQLQYVNQLLSKEPIEITSMVAALLSRFKALAEKSQVSLKLLIPKAHIWIEADNDKLQRVLINLLENAIRHCLPGDEVHLQLLSQGKQLTIKVKDTGCGICAEDLPWIFEPYFTTTNANTNTGLGLTICQSIISLHKSELVVKSTQGEGSCFSFSLPIANELYKPSNEC